MVSFVMATRDDGYGGAIDKVDNFTMRRLKITLRSIEHLKIPYSEIIVVEWCPLAPAIESYVKQWGITNARVITVDKGYEKVLPPLPFYEYLAKDIGIKRAKHEVIIACNPDNIFPNPPDIDFTEDVVKQIKDGMLMRADRLDIPREYAQYKISKVLEQADSPEGLKITRRWVTAGGDFCGFTKSTYEHLGGYDLRHINRGCDTEFEVRAKFAGMDIIRWYFHYHLEHDDSVEEGKDRPKVFMEAKPLSRCVLDEADKYVRENKIIQG